jgi:hypothetical protein
LYSSFSFNFELRSVSRRDQTGGDRRGRNGISRTVLARASQLEVGRKPRRTRHNFFPFDQSLLSFIQCFLTRIQLGFPLGELLFGGYILFWQEQTIAKGISIERTKSFFISETVFFVFRKFARTNRRGGG